MLEADEILSNGFATMGPILDGVMAVHLFNNRPCKRLGLLQHDSGDGGISLRGAMMFSDSVKTAPAAGLECCGPLVGPRPHPGVVELDQSLSRRVESACSFG